VVGAACPAGVAFERQAWHNIVKHFHKRHHYTQHSQPQQFSQTTLPHKHIFWHAQTHTHTTLSHMRTWSHTHNTRTQHCWTHATHTHTCSEISYRIKCSNRNLAHLISSRGATSWA
jgi:hypothetical protein